MGIIWYLLKCPRGKEEDYREKCPDLVNSEKLEEVICFQYQRMMRYGGNWHLEKRMLLPGYIFLSASKAAVMEMGTERRKETEKNVSLIPCEIPYMKELCREGNLVGMSKGVIRNGRPVVTSGPLKGREKLIRKINRHKRTAEIEIPVAGEQKQMTVGLEIYEKDV